MPSRDNDSNTNEDDNIYSISTVGFEDFHQFFQHNSGCNSNTTRHLPINNANHNEDEDDEDDGDNWNDGDEGDDEDKDNNDEDDD